MSVFSIFFEVSCRLKAYRGVGSSFELVGFFDFFEVSCRLKDYRGVGSSFELVGFSILVSEPIHHTNIMHGIVVYLVLHY